MNDNCRITSSKDGNMLNIFIDGILHIKVNMDNILFIQSWAYSANWFVGRFHKRYYIEFTFRGDVETHSEYYNNRRLWKEILDKLTNYGIQ